MIPAGPEIASSLRGAWRLLFMDRAAMARFNLTVEGFWRSFFAAALALPHYLLFLGRPGGAAALEAGWELRAALAYAASWALFPIVTAFLARVLDLGRHYAGFIIAHNWAAALMAQPLLALTLLVRVGLLDEGFSALLQMALFAVYLWYGWAVCRVALGAGVVTACGFVILDHLLDMLIAVLLLGMPAPA